jgi:hypothetical protein
MSTVGVNGSSHTRTPPRNLAAAVTNRPDMAPSPATAPGRPSANGQERTTRRTGWETSNGFRTWWGETRCY